MAKKSKKRRKPVTKKSKTAGKGKGSKGKPKGFVPYASKKGGGRKRKSRAGGR